jgi:N-acetylmuramoyl-L-alanine amidase
MVKLYIDPGHGGKDPGALKNEVVEKTIALKLAKKIAEKLKANYKNIEIKLSRETDVYRTLNERTNEANTWGANAFVSIHCNANDNVLAKGFESYVYPSVDSQTVAFQNVVHNEIMKQFSGVSGVQDRGKKRANFHVLRESNMIALLTENFFVSNSGDANLLKQESMLDRIANGHALGIAKFFGLEEIPIVQKPSSPTLFQVVAGTFSDRENAESQVKKLKADGYDSYIVEKE